MEAAGGSDKATDDIYEDVRHILTEPFVELVVQEDLREIVPKKRPLVASCHFEAKEILTPTSPDPSPHQPQFSFPPIRIPTEMKLQPRVLLHRGGGGPSNNKMKDFKKKVNIEDYLHSDIDESEVIKRPKRGRGRPHKNNRPLRPRIQIQHRRWRNFYLEKIQEQISNFQNGAIIRNVKKEEIILYLK